MNYRELQKECRLCSKQGRKVAPIRRRPKRLSKKARVDTRRAFLASKGDARWQSTLAGEEAKGIVFDKEIPDGK